MAVPGGDARAASAVLKTSEPPSRTNRRLRSRCARSTGASKSMHITFRRCPTLIIRNGAMAAMPAEKNNPSICPVSSASASIWAASARSATNTRWPDPGSLWSVSSNRPGLRPLMINVAPRSAQEHATCRPIPDEAPVTRMDLPSRVKGSSDTELQLDERGEGCFFDVENAASPRESHPEAGKQQPLTTR